MMKYATLLFFLLSALRAGEILRPEIMAIPVSPGSDFSVWEKISAYPLLKEATLPEQLGLLPQERGTLRFGADADNLYIYADLIDTDIVSEATDAKLPLYRTGDCLRIMLNPAGETFFWDIQCAPTGLSYCAFIPGGSRYRLPGTVAPIAVKIPVQVRINGTMNNWHDRDKGWKAVVTIPVKELLKFLEKTGMKWDRTKGFYIMAGRYNCSRELEKQEISAFPQPAAGFENINNYGVLKKTYHGRQ